MDADRRRGICWMTVLNGDCQDEIRSDVTKADCCASIGKAWGSPCEVCPTPGVDGGGPGTLVEPTPGIGVGPDGGPPLRPGACFEGFFLSAAGPYTTRNDVEATSGASTTLMATSSLQVSK